MNRPTSRRELFLPLLLMTAGLFLVFHPTLLSGFSRIQTDLGDTRLNNYFLEHSYQWVLRSELHRSFWDLPIFFPIRNTAAYSDILLAAAPPYWLLRLIGFLPDTAFQGWMLLMVALDFLAAFLLFRRAAGFSVLAAAGGAYVFAFAGIRANQLNAPQMLPQFFSVLAVFCLFKIFETSGPAGDSASGKRSWWIGLFAGCVVLQFYTGFYLGFFLCLGLLVFFLAALPFAGARRALWDTFKANWRAIVSAGLLSALALSWMGWHYLISQIVFGSRNWSEIAAMIPKPKSWINMGPQNWIYGWSTRYLDFSALPDGPENRLGLGLVTFAIAAAGCMRMWNRIWGKIMVVALVILGASTLMYPWDWTPWETLSRLIVGAGAIRCVARVSLLLLIPLSFAVAFFFNGLRGRVVAAIFLLVVGLEQAQTTPSYSKSLARANVEKIAAQVPPHCKAFYFVTTVPEGVKPASWYEYQLDAMWAETVTGVATVNGFSGHIPPAWWPLWQAVLKTRQDFLQTRLNLYKWADENHVPPDEVCLAPILAAPLEGPEPDLANVELKIGKREARPFLGEGWGEDEWDKDVSWAWAVGKRASSYVALRPGARYAMTVVAGPMEAAGRKQIMTVILNGVRVARIEMAKGMNPYHVELPAEAIRDFNRIDFVFAHAMSPLSLGQAPDPRALAAAFERIVFSLSP